LAHHHVLARPLPPMLVVLLLFSASITIVGGVMGDIVFLILGGRVYVYSPARGSEVSIEFNNSVTGSPVRLVFSYCSGLIRGRAMYTDDAGADYCSMGVLDVNRSVSSYASGYLAFCTSQDLYGGAGDSHIALEGGGVSPL